MQEISNKSYNRIMKHVLNDPNINSQEKRILVKYATQLYKNDIENIEAESVYDIIKALKCITEELKKGTDTNIFADRLKKITLIFSSLCDVMDSKKSDLSSISYEVDKMYLDLDIKIRKTSSLSYNLNNLMKTKNKGR